MPRSEAASVRRRRAAASLVLVARPAARLRRARSTPHNLSASGTGTVTSHGEYQQVCVFCHTPHGATSADEGGVGDARAAVEPPVPAGATYTPYTSSSLDAQCHPRRAARDQPGGSSKLCLSCHDGTLAIGNVNVLNGQDANAGRSIG